MGDKMNETDASLMQDNSVKWRVIDGHSPVLEVELAAGVSITAVADSFLAKSPDIEMLPAEDVRHVRFHNQSAETELLYLAPQQIGAMMMFDLSLYRQGLIVAAPSLFAFDDTVNASLVLDVPLGEGASSHYQLYQLTGDGVMIAFMGGDLFPLPLTSADIQQVTASSLAAMEPSVSFELDKLGDGHFVASLTGPGRIWLQSLPSERQKMTGVAADIAQNRAQKKGLFRRR